MVSYEGLPKTIGFIGLGGMGGRMAARLVQAGAQVVGYDVSAPAAEAAAQTGVTVVDELPAVAAAADRILMSLPNSKIVDAVIFGEGGLLPSLQKGTLIGDLSSGDPRWVRPAWERLREHDVRFVDIPVSGGLPGASDGTLTIMAGGDEADLAEITKVIAPLGTLTRVGGPGAGHLAKALNNTLYACELCISAEALVAGKLWGIESGTLVDVWSRSSSRNGAVDGRIRKNVLARDFTGAMASSLMLKDIRHAIALGDDLGLEMTWARETEKHFERFIEDHGASTVDFGVVQLWEERAGVKIE